MSPVAAVTCFGKDRLRQAIRDAAAQPAAAIAAHITDQLTAFRDGALQREDITFIVVKMLA